MGRTGRVPSASRGTGNRARTPPAPRRRRRRGRGRRRSAPPGTPPAGTDRRGRGEQRGHRRWPERPAPRPPPRPGSRRALPPRDEGRPLRPEVTSLACLHVDEFEVASRPSMGPIRDGSAARQLTAVDSRGGLAAPPAPTPPVKREELALVGQLLEQRVDVT